ncbi:MFS transporter [Rhizomicrobium electricum]|uniref:MFS transporter n=1 Tax=Rhizomicrobium electricum TaxID=480070 RepID=A0ABP3PEH5_9PROT
MPGMRPETSLRDEEPVRPALAVLGVFRHRNFRLFFAGQLVSLMGTWMQTVAQAWLVYALTHSPLLLGLTTFCSQVTVFFLAPFGGLVADRVDRRRLLLVTQSAAMLQAAVLAGLTLAGVVRVWEIVALAFGLGLINAFDMPTRQAMLLDMVGTSDLRHAIAVNSMMFNLARVIGPSLAGAVIALTGEGWCFALNAVSFSAVLASLWLMRLTPRLPRRHDRPLDEIAEGYRYSFHHRLIRVSLFLIAASSCFGAAYLTLMPAFARDMLHGSAAHYGVLMAAVGAGAFVGAYGLSLIKERWLVAAPVIAGAVFGIGLMAFSQSQGLWQAVVVLVPTAMCLMIQGGTTNTIIQLAAGERFRGRVISHYSQAFIGMMPWGALILGALADRFGVREAILWGGSVVLASSTLGWLMRRGQVWKLENLRTKE